MNASKRLRHAMRDLLKSYPFEKITVDMLVDSADVSRSTFYRLYADKYALAADYYTHIADNILSRADGTNWRELLVEVLEFFSSNKSVYQKLLEASGYNSFFEFLHRYTEMFYRKRYLAGTGKQELDMQDKISLDFLSKGQVGILVSWLQRDCKDPADIKEFADVMYELIPESFRKYL